MKKPNTKKLSKKNIMAAVDRDNNPYNPLFEDEVFYQVPKYPDIFVSQYARVMQIHKKKKPRLLSPYYEPQSGYSKIVLINECGERKCYGLHGLVAKVWCEKPIFHLEDEPLEVHHMIKVKSNLKLQPIDLNFAENLIYVYRKYHKMLDLIRSIKIRTFNGAWKYVQTISEIAKYYNLDEQSIYELLNGNQTQVINKLEYYIETIKREDGTEQEVVIEIRKYAKPYKKKKRKSKKKYK